MQGISNIHRPDFLKAALFWFNFGLPVVPIIQGKKYPALTRHPWLDELSTETIIRHWEKYPNNEVAIIISKGFVVLDADSPKAIRSLESIENSHDIVPNLVIRTRRGVHHYFSLKEGVYAPSDTHDSEKHPDKIDVLGEGRQAIVPPSTAKIFEVNNAKNLKDLVAVDQNFIDSVFLMNDREVPRPPGPKKNIKAMRCSGNNSLKKLGTLLECLDPDCSYGEWTKIAMAIFHETAGSEEGLVLFDSWSSKGDKYVGQKAIENKWKSFRSDVDNPITIGTLIKMVRDKGIDWHYSTVDEFDVCETITINPTVEVQNNAR